MTPILRTEGLSKYYVNGQNIVAGLNRVSLSFQPGEFVAITGESGSGKSTLAHVLGGILPYEDGELYIAGEPTAHYDSAQWETYRRDHVAFISQNYGILPGTTVYDNVASALRLGGLDKEQVESRTRAILEEVELWPMRHRRAARLSSGQKQRLAIARALAKPCAVLIADEPTGNLDPGNSEKVIRLLAQAAKDRLVILITHEFSEAADYVTRHIRIHDGVIAGDEQIRTVPPKIWEPAPKMKRPRLGGYIAALQLRSRPVWVSIVLLFFVATAFSVFAFLGTFLVAVDDTPTKIYQSDAFLNGSKDRIVVVRKDGQELTEVDYETILSINHVMHLERYGYLTDTLYAYQEGVDYETHYYMENIGSTQDPVYKRFENVQIITKDQFFRSVPYGLEGFLASGRLPETAYEVVAGDAGLLGKTLRVYVQDPKNWSSSYYIVMDMEVVGVTDLGTGLYFSDELAQALSIEFLDAEIAVLPWYNDVPRPVEYVPYTSATAKAQAEVNNDIATPFALECLTTDDAGFTPLEKSEIIISFTEFQDVWRGFVKENRYFSYDTVYAYGGYSIHERYEDAFAEADTDIFVTNQMYYDRWAQEWVTVYLFAPRIAYIHDSTLPNLIYIHPEKYAWYLANHQEGIRGQVSLTIEDYSYTDRVISQLEQKDYLALSPYVLGSTVVDEELAAQRMQTLYVCLGALIAVILLQAIVMRALFAMTHGSYRTLSQIGLTWAGARNSVWLQILLFMVVGQALGFGLIGLGSYLGIQRLVNLTKYLAPPYWALLSGVHLTVSLVAAMGILSAIKKKVFPQADKIRDLAPRRKEAAV